VVIASWLNADVPRKRMSEAHELACGLTASVPIHSYPRRDYSTQKVYNFLSNFRKPENVVP
jgi:hypothetical protein